MPYESAKQERWAHTQSAKKAGFPTAEFDKASKGMHLPEHSKHHYDGKPKETHHKPKERHK